MGILVCMVFGSVVLSALPAGASVWENASEFYERYGTGTICFHEGSFYYASRGSEGSSEGIRYAVSGQKFSLTDGTKNTYVCTIALDGDQVKGSCKRISYITADGFRYSLYRVQYQTLYKRFQLKYPDTDFSEVMYNHKVKLQIDFCLCLSVDGEDQGYIKEQNDGRTLEYGHIYKSYEAICQAEEWSEQTVSALKGYFGISMSITEPSTYKIKFQKGLSGALGTMKTQKIEYGVKQRLLNCGFSMSVHVFYVDDESKSERVCSLGFLGWSEKEKGNVKYKNRQAVKNLSNKQGDCINLYARWESALVTLPTLEEAGFSCSDKDTRFIGWSTEKYEIQPSGTGADQLKDVYEPGDKVKISGNTVYYAVWAKIRKRIVFRTPSSDKKMIAELCYDSGQVKILRTQVARFFKKGFDFRNCFSGSELFEILISSSQS